MMTTFLASSALELFLIVIPMQTGIHEHEENRFPIELGMTGNFYEL